MKVLLALILAAAPAAADEVVLRNGSVFSGVVQEQGDRVTIRMDYGTMTFRKVDVRDIRKSDDPLKELELKTLAASTAKDYFDLALWAKDRGLQGRSDELLNRVIFLEPDHEAARQALGYERFEGRWLKADEAMVARGYIKHDGKWLKRETVEQLLAQEHAETLERDRQRTILRVADIERGLELEKIELERERIDAEARRARWWTSGYWPAGPSYVLPPASAGGPAFHPGYGPGRTLPPVPDRLYPGGLPSVTPPPTSSTWSSGTTCAPPTKGGGPPITTNK